MDSNSLKKLLIEHAPADSSTATLAQLVGISKEAMDFYLKEGKFPLGEDLQKLLTFLDISENSLRLKVGSFSYSLKDSFLELPATQFHANHHISLTLPNFKTEYGKLFNVDCMDLLHSIPSNYIDMIFVDPPFNLSKSYPSKINDSLSYDNYIRWSEQWLMECCRILKTGGSFFLWNLPKWNFIYASILNEYLYFRNWIAVDIKYSLPIKNRLYPSHYSLLYFVKGKYPSVFSPDRLEMKTCKKCFNEIKDYGGYKNKMNPHGINLSDVWDDISPVRHSKYKKRKDANELPLKLLDRIIEMSTKEDDIVLDPFGGSGTTYIVAELKKRKWIGSEIGPIDIIKNRFSNLIDERYHLKKIRSYYNLLFSQEVSEKRKKNGIWVPEDLKRTFTTQGLLI